MGTRFSGYERRPLDFYETPTWVTQALLRRVNVCGTVWEPACGGGKIVRALAPRNILATDIVSGYDFLEDKHVYPIFDWIVTNPPFGQGGRVAHSFIRKALDHHANGVAMLLSG